MSETLKIKLTIANRVYPLSIPADQEFSLRESARKIDNTIQQLEKNYAVRDKQDVLAMCSLQFATQVENYKRNASTSRTYDDEKTKKYFVNDLSLNYNFYNAYKFYFNITNMFDEEYETARDYSQHGRSFNIGLKRLY